MYTNTINLLFVADTDSDEEASGEEESDASEDLLPIEKSAKKLVKKQARQK